MTALDDFLEAEIARAPRFSKRRRDDIARRRLLAHGTKAELQAILAGLAERRMAPEERRSWWQKPPVAPIRSSPWARSPSP